MESKRIQKEREDSYVGVGKLKDQYHSLRTQFLLSKKIRNRFANQTKTTHMTTYQSRELPIFFDGFSQPARDLDGGSAGPQPPCYSLDHEQHHCCVFMLLDYSKDKERG